MTPLVNGKAPAPAAVRLVMQSAADIEPERLAWLWPGRIPLGKLTVLAGVPKEGKSLLMCELAATVSTGRPWPDRPEAWQPVGVIMLSAEDDASDTIVPRLLAAGADLDRISIVRGCEDATGAQCSIRLDLGVAIVESALAAHPGAKLLIIDPITAFMGAADSNSNTEVRRILGELADIAARRGVAVVAVTHLNKVGGKASVSAKERIIGSVAFLAAARAALLVSRDPRDMQPGSSRRLLSNIGMNLARDPGGLTFDIESDSDDGPARIVWGESVETDADTALAALDASRRPERTASAKHRAEQWIIQQLSAGPVESAEFERRAALAGISRSTLKRARAELRVKPSFDGARWIVALAAPEGTELTEADILAESVGPDGTDETLEPLGLLEPPDGNEESQEDQEYQEFMSTNTVRMNGRRARG